MTDEYIKNHFITNPEWKRVFLKHFPLYSAQDYMEKALKVFEINGYKITTKRMSERKTSAFYRVIDATLLYKDDFVFSQQSHEDSAVEQVIISCICNYDVDITKFN